MASRCPSRKMLTAASRASLSPCRDLDIATNLSRLSLNSTRPFSFSIPRSAVPSLSKTTNTPTTRFTDSKETGKGAGLFSDSGRMPVELRKPPAQAAAERAKAVMKAQQEEAEKMAGRQGKLADNSLFSEAGDARSVTDNGSNRISGTANNNGDTISLADRSLSNMAQALNPRPTARAQWHRRMVIRDVRRAGRWTKEMTIARNERTHLSRSHFFKTSMKKLAPLARQIAGKPLDEAILQMRFSKKKAAIDVRAHLMQARNEAIVIKGMGLRPQPSDANEPELSSKHLVADPAVDPAIETQLPTKALKKGVMPQRTDMYIAQAWVNRGPYGQEPEYRARGRMNILRPPHTGISVLVKEESTRIREKKEKEDKEIRKRLGKNMWTQMPDRPVTRQSQHVLW